MEKEYGMKNEKCIIDRASKTLFISVHDIMYARTEREML